MTTAQEVAYVAMTVSWPGSWAKAKTAAAAKRSLKRHMLEYERGARVAVFEIHPDTEINELGDFIHPKGHGPKQVE